jgi:hypothetical protein
MLSDKGRKYMKQMMDTVQGQVDEQVLACSMFTTAGAMASMGVGMISPLAGILMRRSGKKKGDGLPINVGLVVTPTKVHVFGMKPSRGKMVPKSLEQTWERNQIQVRTEDKAMATKVVVDFPHEGRQVELEATKGSGGMSEEVIRYLSQPSLTEGAV